MFSLKKLKFFFTKYNAILNTNYLYFILPCSYLDIVKFFYASQLIPFYKISNQTIYIYLPKNLNNFRQFKNLCNKHQKIYHSVKQLNSASIYLTSFGLLFGKQAKQLNCGGRLVYSF